LLDYTKHRCFYTLQLLEEQLHEYFKNICGNCFNTGTLFVFSNFILLWRKNDGGAVWTQRHSLLSFSKISYQFFEFFSINLPLVRSYQSEVIIVQIPYPKTQRGWELNIDHVFRIMVAPCGSGKSLRRSACRDRNTHQPPGSSYGGDISFFILVGNVTLRITLLFSILK